MGFVVKRRERKNLIYRQGPTKTALSMSSPPTKNAICLLMISSLALLLVLYICCTVCTHVNNKQENKLKCGPFT